MILATALFAALAAGPTVSLETSMGTIKIELDRDKAPVTVDNFVTYVRAGHYDGTIFHRVIPNFMIQGGGMVPSMREKQTRPAIKNEASNGLRNVRGSIAMARTSEPNSATSQFFINVKDNAMLDFGVGGAGYAVFGKVVSGMDVVDRIVSAATTSKGPHQNVPVEPILIQKARVEDAAAAPQAETTRPGTERPQPAQPASTPRR